MTDEALEGAGAAERMLEQLPIAAKEELGVELAILGREGLAMQKAATPVASGELRAGLSLELQLQQLYVRIGLIGTKARSKSAQRRARKLGVGSLQNLGDLFYGRIVNFGRHSQTVLRQRRRLKAAALLKRRRPADVGTPKPLKVKGRAAVDFIDAPGPDFEATAIGQLNEFWVRTFKQAGADA